VVEMVQAVGDGTARAAVVVAGRRRRVGGEEGAVAVLDEPGDWAAGGEAGGAAVASFGVSGTNAQVIIEEAPSAPEPVDGAVDGAADEAVAPAEVPDAPPLPVSLPLVPLVL
ncbi:hypothetical protein VM98_36685, partial [Streptomyces rubellomurinus subsp. indigoferus]